MRRSANPRQQKGSRRGSHDEYDWSFHATSNAARGPSRKSRFGHRPAGTRYGMNRLIRANPTGGLMAPAIHSGRPSARALASPIAPEAWTWPAPDAGALASSPL